MVYFLGNTFKCRFQEKITVILTALETKMETDLHNSTFANSLGSEEEFQRDELLYTLFPTEASQIKNDFEFFEVS